MDNYPAGKIRTSFFFFFFSAILYFIIGLLYSWGTPLWLDNLPNASGFRFLLSLGIFFLCCTLFFFIQHVLTVSGGMNIYWKIFIPAFVPVIIFSGLILNNTPLQFIQTFSGITDTAIWIIVLFFLAYFKKNLVNAGLGQQILFIWFVCAAIQVVTEVLFLTSVIPGTISIAIRLITFTICSLYTGIIQPLQYPEDIDRAAALFKLSRREKEVLCLIMEGKTNDKIADELFISLSTVKTHIAKIFEKTGAKNRLEAAALCRKR